MRLNAASMTTKRCNGNQITINYLLFSTLLDFKHRYFITTHLTYEPIDGLDVFNFSFAIFFFRILNVMEKDVIVRWRRRKLAVIVSTVLNLLETWIYKTIRNGMRSFVKPYEHIYISGIPNAFDTWQLLSSNSVCFNVYPLHLLQ